MLKPVVDGMGERREGEEIEGGLCGGFRLAGLHPAEENVVGDERRRPDLKTSRTHHTTTTRISVFGKPQGLWKFQQSFLLYLYQLKQYLHALKGISQPGLIFTLQQRKASDLLQLFHCVFNLPKCNLDCAQASSLRSLQILTNIVKEDNV